MEETWENVKAAIIGFHRMGATVNEILLIIDVELAEIEKIIKSLKN